MTRSDPEFFAPSRRDLLKGIAALVSASALTLGKAEAQVGTDFPAIGKRYLVDFVRFRVELYFTSPTSLTYTGVKPDGSHGQSETVVIRVESIGEMLFLVTWQESDKTTVVHVEDYVKKTIITNITNPDGSFEQYHGTFTELR